MGETCAKCGKELSWLESKQDPNYRATCFKEKYPEFLGKKLCKPCGKQLSLEGGLPRFVTKSQDQQITLHNQLIETLGRLKTQQAQQNFVNCQYCKTRYDANQYFKCPHCGSPTT